MAQINTEVINVEEEDDDRLRRDIYADFDELADLAVTSCEPPPPGTRPLQEELLTLITENTVAGVTINKEEVVAWLRNEDALLTGGSSGSFPYPSPPNSGDKDSLSDTSSSPRRRPRTRSDRSVKKYRTVSSVVVRSRENSAKHPASSPRSDSSREHLHRRSGERSQHRRHHHHGRTGEARAKSNRDHSDRKRNLQEHDSGSRSRSRHGVTTRRHGVATRRNGLTTHLRRRSGENRDALNEEYPALSRRVKLNRKVDDIENDRNTSRYYKKEVSPAVTVTSQGKGKDLVFGLKDAREILANKRAPAHSDDDLIAKYEREIKNSEMGARKLVRQARHAKRDLQDFLSVAIRREREELRVLEDKRRERDRGTRSHRPSPLCHRDSGSLRRRAQQPTRQDKRHRSRDERPRQRDSEKEKPDNWKLLAPTEVDGFNCSGPALFVQRFGRNVSRKGLFTHFKEFGTVMDIQLLELGRKSERSACVIFSRQSEADRALQQHRPAVRSRSSSVEEITCSPSSKVELDILQPCSTFDILLNALNRDD